MEKGDKKACAHNCGVFCSCGKMSGSHMFVKLFLALVIIALVLAICMAFVVKMGKGSKAYKYSMRGQAVTAQCAGGERFGAAMRAEGGKMMFKAEKPASMMPERIFATVLKIEANQITVKNNAAAEQIVLSQADTVIVSSSTEVGLSALQPNMNIVVYGSIDKDKKFEAKLIQIQ